MQFSTYALCKLQNRYFSQPYTFNATGTNLQKKKQKQFNHNNKNLEPKLEFKKDCCASYVFFSFNVCCIYYSIVYIVYFIPTYVGY